MKHPREFTFTEIVVIVAVVAALAALSVPAYKLLVTRARVAAAISVLNTLSSNETSFYQRTGQLPTDIGQINAGNVGSAAPASRYVRSVRLERGGKLVAVLNPTEVAMVSAGSNEVAVVPQPTQSAIRWRCGPNINRNPVAYLLLPMSCQDTITAQ